MLTINHIVWATIAQSVQRLATGLTDGGSNPGGGDIFHTPPEVPWGPLSLLYNEYRVFPGGKTAGEWRWPSSAEVKKRVELCLYSPFGPSWSAVNVTLYPYHGSQPPRHKARLLSARASYPIIDCWLKAGLLVRQAAQKGTARYEPGVPKPSPFFKNSLICWGNNCINEDLKQNTGLVFVNNPLICLTRSLEIQWKPLITITLGPALFDNNNRLITLSGEYKNLHNLTEFIVTTFYMYKKQQVQFSLPSLL